MPQKISAKRLKELAEKLFNSMDVGDQTRKDYLHGVKLFIDFSRQHEIDPDIFLKYKNYLHKQNHLTSSSKAKYMVPARLLLKEINRKGIIGFDPTQNIRGFSKGRKHKKEGLNLTEVMRYAQYVKKQPQDEPGSRLKALFCLCVYQGLRTVEIERLTVPDIDFEGERIFIWGKARDDKEPVELHPETLKNLRVYIQKNYILGGPLFPSRRDPRKSLTRRQIRRIMTGPMKELGIEKSTHGFRHFFVTHMIKVYDGDLMKTMRRSRHQDIGMLEVYNDEKMSREEIQKFKKSFGQIRV